MWFRLSSSGQQATIEPTIPPTMGTPISPNTLYVPTTTTYGEKLDKFRMGSFKKKNEQRQRSKSPLWYKSCSVEEEVAVDKTTENGMVESTPNDQLNEKSTSTEASSENALPLPLIVCDPKSKQTKKTLKGIKTDPPKRKFYKNFTSSKSHEESEPEKEKEKVLLTDRKFKNNRIEKSSSKTKINAGVAGGGDLEKRESIKRSARKISAPPVLSDIGKKSSASLLKDGTSYACLSDSEPPKKSNVRAHSNLNLHALVKLVSNKKFLSSEDFALIRRKSLSEAASSVIAIAANHCKPLPIALKCSTDGTVAKDDVSNGNVVLVRHDLKGSFCDRLNNNNNNNNNCSNKNNIKKRCSTSSNGSIKSNDSMRRRESDEEFYSCDDDAVAAVVAAGSATATVTATKDAANDVKRKSSPSLTSRVAAKITETTNNYKNRKANKTPKKKKKTTVNVSVVQAKRPEYYKQLSIERLHSTSIVRQPSDRRPDVANTSINSTGNTSHNTSELQTSQSLDADTNALDAEKDTKRDRSKSKSAPVSVNRSESYKERLSHKRNRNNRRKTSDPSLSSKPNDDQPDLGLSNSNYTASSNSSLSSGGGSESPSTSMEQVGGPVPIGATIQNTSSNMFSANVVSQAQSLASGHPRQWIDSDDDDDLVNEVDWSSNITAEVLAALTDAEKKRQEIINEIYQTERSHVRTLKLLEGIFMRPLQECAVLPNDHLHLLFPPALLSLKELHSSFEQKLKMRRIEHNHIVQQVGDLLAGMFDGQSGEELREFAAKFCARQQIALEALKEKRRKDENLQRFLTKAESHKACRRLQLKDLLPTVLQRLTKYPLLFENLYKITKRVVPDDNAEAEAVQRALDSSKRILVDVNQAVKTAEDAHKLQTIQRKLDKSTFDKEEFRNLDLTQLKLVHDGSLTMKKNPGTQLYGLLFENMVLLLTKQDDKYALKNLQNISTTGTTELNKFISPITYFDQQTLVRQSAVDKNTFFLIITKTSQMLELRAPSSSECKTWFKHISDAAEQYKQRSKSSHEVVEDPASATLPHSNTKESLESTPERQAPSTATATATTTAANPTTNNNVSDRESTPGAERNRNSLPNNNNSLDIGGGHAGGSRSRSISRNGSRNESNNNDYDSPTATDDAKQLRQQSADEEAAAAASKARRDNSSLYSNNSNNTRTLMQNSPLVEPSAIQISISPAHTAEPVLTPSERLKRLDNSIRENLVEKQKIICDMFRLPIEHFNEIVDIAAQPEAPKDSSDIALAAYAQVQSLTEVLNDYMKINSTEQEISAVSTVVCDQCHQTQQQQHLLKCTQTTGVRSLSPLPLSVASTNTATTVIPNETSSNSTAVPTSPAPAIPAVATTAAASAATTPASNNILTTLTSVDADHVIHEDDDGYCEIDELRLPSVPLSKPPASGSGSSSGGGSGSGTFKTPLPIGVAAEMVSRASTTPELIKRQSTISTDSIPEESEHDMTQLDEPTLSSSMSISKAQYSSKDEGDVQIQQLQQQQQQCESNGSIDQSQLENSCSSSLKQRNYADDSLGSEHIEINDTYDTMVTLAKLNSLSLNDGNESVSGHHCNSPGLITCGPNRLLHANSLEPSVPCHLINGIITTLNSQISLLLPKINERDQERERLRRENQHLRELLNAMHERQRVEASMETPAEITKSADTSNETTSTTITAAVVAENKTTTDQPSSPP